MSLGIVVATKSEIVYDKIKNYIINGKLEPGEKYSISKLAKDFGISRSPVYEAVKLLEKEDFVTIIPNVGFKVNTLTRKEIHDLLRIQGALEGLAIREAMDNIGEEEIEELNKILDRTEKYYNNNKIDKYVEENKKFHFKLYKYSQSNKLLNVLKDYWRYEIWYTQNSDEIKSNICNLIDDHRELLEIIEEGKEEKVQDFIDEHIKDCEQVVLNNLESTKMLVD
ncbi:MAG: GntR family transcriptional regulator [Candidatus Cloacimonetes bacterium]|nr:GntR family transcriptional regulator [Candidatus Cloacimonadota bacterium]